MNARIAGERLLNQLIAAPTRRDPAQVVAWFGAMQAQDYPAARWGVGLRMRHGATAADFQRAFNEGRILRTHVMRPTWHFVAAEDIEWMRELSAPRIRQSLAYACREYGVDDKLRRRAVRAIERALGKVSELSRAELAADLARAGLRLEGPPFWLAAIHAELDGVMCSGPMRGKEQTYAVLGMRVPRPRHLPRDQAIAELTLRYFRSHGPATVRDFAWWSGLTVAEARKGIEICGLDQEVSDGRAYARASTARETHRATSSVHLLPMFDEYVVAYRDHDAVPRLDGPGQGLQAALVCGGEIAGTWKVAPGRGGIVVQVRPARRLTRTEREAIDAAAARYGRFLETPVSCSRAG